MRADIAKVLIERDTIDARVRALADQIAGDLRPAEGEGPAEITLVPILIGSMIFLADLIRRLPLPMQIRVIGVSSYPGEATASRGARLRPALSDLPPRLEGRHVLIVDDILDSGQTLDLVTREVRRREPTSLRTCVLLRKRRPAAMRFAVDYVAFDIPDAFVVGYGLDYNDYYRNLPEIVTLKPEVIARA